MKIGYSKGMEICGTIVVIPAQAGIHFVLWYFVFGYLNLFRI